MQLPEASTEAKEDSATPLIIQIDAEGRYFVNNSEVVNSRIETLKAALEQLGGKPADQPVVLRADARAQHQAVVTAMDALAQVRDTGIALSPADERFVLAVQPVPRQLAADALAVQRAYSEYQQRALARGALRRMYIGTLTLALVLAVFGAVLLAALLGHQLVRPLLLLADGVRQVAAGDLSSKPVFASRDELGGLTRSFADMTQQLADAREDVQRGVTQLGAGRGLREAVGGNVGERVTAEVAQRLGNQKQHHRPSDEPAGGVDEPIESTRGNQTGDAKK